MTPARRAVRQLPLLLLLAAACEPTFTFTFSRTTPLPLPACPLPESADGGAGLVGDVTVDSTADVDNQGLDPGDVKSIRLRRVSLHVDPAGTDLAYVNEMDVYVSAPGEPEALVAQQDRFPEGQRDVALQVTGVNLRDYATAPQMELRLRARLARCPGEDQGLLVHTTFEVRATPQGLLHGAKRAAGSL